MQLSQAMLWSTYYTNYTRCASLMAQEARCCYFVPTSTPSISPVTLPHGYIFLYIRLLVKTIRFTLGVLCRIQQTFYESRTKPKHESKHRGGKQLGDNLPYLNVSIYTVNCTVLTVGGQTTRRALLGLPRPFCFLPNLCH